jgi:hypothetical protein
VGDPHPLVDAAPDSWIRLLARAPDTLENQGSLLGIVDLGRARRQAGVDPLPTGASDADLTVHLATILGRDRLPSLQLAESASSEQLRGELGFSYDQVDQVITAGPPPRNIYLAVGRFDAAQIAETLEADPTWGPRLEVKTHRGVDYYSWGDDYAIVGDPSPARPLGRGGRLVVGDDWLSWSFGDEQAEATIDAALDPTRSLATVNWLRTATEAADTADLTQFSALAEPDEETFTTEILADPDLPPIDAPRGSSGGQNRSSDGGVSQFVFLYPTEAAAAANLEAFEETWVWIDPQPPAEIRRQGPALIATVTSPPGQPPPEVIVETISGDRYPLTPLGLLPLFNVRTNPPARPTLPDAAPTQEEIIADGEVSQREYEIAFWTFVDCAEAAGDTFTDINQGLDGQYSYSASASAAVDTCYTDHFMLVDRDWQLAHE